MCNIQSWMEQLAEELFPGNTRLARRRQPADELALLTPALPERQLEERIARLEEEGVEILGKIRLLQDE